MIISSQFYIILPWHISCNYYLLNLKLRTVVFICILFSSKISILEGSQMVFKVQKPRSFGGLRPLDLHRGIAPGPLAVRGESSTSLILQEFFCSACGIPASQFTWSGWHQRGKSPKIQWGKRGRFPGCLTERMWQCQNFQKDLCFGICKTH